MSEEKRKDAEIKRLETELDMVQTAWQELKEENVKLLQTLLSLYRSAQKKPGCIWATRLPVGEMVNCGKLSAD